jgi:cyclic beta-1,2-glucan synthetase
VTPISKILTRLIARQRRYWRQRGQLRAGTEAESPLSAELFSADQMRQHGIALAGTHSLSASPGPDRLLQRLGENEALLHDVRDVLTAAVTAERRITPAGVWLVDNAELIDEQIRLARRHLPKGYSRELPRLLTGPSAGLPRVYDLALETIAHGDGRIDLDSLVRFIEAYQSLSVLKLGELWAIPIMLRLALLENLRRASARIVADQLDRDRAESWAAQMLDVARRDPKSLILVIADMARSDPPLTSAFVAELARRLEGQSAALALPLTWIEQRLSESGVTIERLVQLENHRQAADQLSISNSIGSLRLLAVTEWRDVVERMSAVERILQQDPAQAYARMDFATRDAYRHRVERLARRSDRSEPEVAQLAIGLAHEALAEGRSDCADPDAAAHVGFYLIDAGAARLRQLAGTKSWRWSTGFEALRRVTYPAALFGYVGPIVALTTIFTAGLAWHAQLALVFLLLLCSSSLAVALVNWLVTALVPPRVLPRLDFSTGIPAESRSLVAVPTLLGNTASVAALLEALEVRFLANQDPHLHFALLTDLLDAPTETLPADAGLIQQAADGIEALNDKYADTVRDRFFLFHRARRWNAQEQRWMGYERKRGKLEQLNAALRGDPRGFSLVVGDTATLAAVRYVVTLDSDTQLPRDAARKLVGAMAHPLNRPRYDAALKRVTRGYGILQPRVESSLLGSLSSRYARLSGGETGTDPYTRSVSDVYQDLFGEGSFIGKGVYDVDAFQSALHLRLPENRILSHDLLEGCHARSGLLSDVELYEDYPAHYAADMARRHRWIRGDWQLLPWLLPWVPAGNGHSGQGWQKNPLSNLSRWKIFDNLRRSLVPIALTALLLLGWSVLGEPVFWSGAVVGILLVPALCASLLDLFRFSTDTLLRQHLIFVLRSTLRLLAGTMLTLACLPFEALRNADAILRSLWRMAVTRRHLLEWNPSNPAVPADAATLKASYSLMWSTPFIAATTLAGLLLAQSPALLAAAPILVLWLLSPVLIWWLNHPAPRRETPLTDSQRLFLRRLARRTWSFFETYQGPDDNYLPPDNVQEVPTLRVAHRSSPTNIGLSLLANLSAYDFGYITTGVLLERTAATLGTMQRLERYRGHFYNWYDTQSLEVLTPPYVSTVDSGNLVGHLLTLIPGLQALNDAPSLHPRWREGLEDTLALLVEAIETLPDRQKAREVMRTVETFRAQLDSAQHEALLQTASALQSRLADCVDEEARRWADALLQQCRSQLDEWRQPATAARSAQIGQLVAQCREFTQIEYDFLYDAPRHLLAIGYHVATHRLDPGHYDLLASEARLCNFVAIAQGRLPEKSWFALGRRLTTAGGDPILVSWSGSIFEYLMPLLVMPTYANTLLDRTCRAAVQYQIEYGRSRGVPWGVSESGYNAVDAHLNYQYQAFGIPGLGLKRGLAQDLVVAPYASAMALMVAPAAACANLQRLTAEGFCGRHGLFEAIDYTSSRLPPGQTCVLLRSFMAHHQGMSLLSIAHALLDQPMQKRFVAEPQIQASLLLLQERVPKPTADYARRVELVDIETPVEEGTSPYRIYTTPDTATPQVQLLSNGRYHVMVSNAGGGYSRWNDLAVSRWREDSTRDHWGSFCYLRDVSSGLFWSTAHQPTLARADSYEAVFSESRAEFRRRDGDIESHTEIVVSPEDDIELRRVHLTNHGRTRREIEITSYAEVVLAPPIADALHPAFSNLFVQTELLRNERAILCTRRPRSEHEATPHMFHLMAVRNGKTGGVSFETDRLQFIGRGNTVAAPAALQAAGPLHDSAGSVLDPIVAIRDRIILEPGQSVVTDLVFGVGSSRDACLGLIAKYEDRYLTDRVFDLAWTHNQVTLRQINASDADARLFARLGASILYANASLRAPESVLLANRRGQSGLWGYAISGDLPIVLLQIQDIANLELVRLLVRAHAYWRLKGLAVDLVIWNEDHAGYRQVLHEQIMGLIAVGLEASVMDRPGGVFVRHAEQISHEDRTLLQSVARIVLKDSAGTLAEQLDRAAAVQPTIPQLKTTRTHRLEPEASPPPRELILGNEYGGFSAEGHEYVITTTADRATPAPWANVLANAHFGSVISESGSAYTWGENAHQFRLTPWHNDAVTDASGEAIYLRDEDSGHFWSPTALPCRGTGAYTARHGFGYSVFEHSESGIVSELTVFVAVDAPVKFSLLKIRNESGRSRRLSATGYVEWLLGDLQAKSAPHVTTLVNAVSGALFARNPYNAEFADRIAFFDADDLARSTTTDRTEFLGRNGSLRNPQAMHRARLSGRMGAGLDPCAAIQVPFELADGEERQVIFRLGLGRDLEQAGVLVQRYRQLGAARKALAAVSEYWQRTLGTVQVETPDPALNVLANGWLVYQTLACRLWARSGYYQSGGAYGFRDQLQDVMALVHAEPALVREHLLRCAHRQFREGDVQHWWHPHSGRGVRTTCSDDYLWLPLATCRYIASTGDHALLNETAPFLEARLLNPGEESNYDLPGRSPEVVSLYEHCKRAVLYGLRFGAHGLPLMGSGDWNDGMNKVGEHGRGESVWLGFFLCQVLQEFAQIAQSRADLAFAERCRTESTKLAQNLERGGWDGDWYRRAYFDDGQVLGSASNVECQIDSIAQSWSVLSGAGDPERARRAMEALDARLVRRDARLIQLFDPPFNGILDPGYIRGYVPGVRENGGQYTHSAVWAAMAFAQLGDRRRAWELLDIINPVKRARTADEVATYKVEPYVLAADIYGVPPHTSRGGWTWYTGSAGWMYRLVLESLLGLRVHAGQLRVAPLLPESWNGFTLHYRYLDTPYRIVVSQQSGATGVSVDDVHQPDGAVTLVNDGVEHTVEVRVL